MNSYKNSIYVWNLFLKMFHHQFKSRCERNDNIHLDLILNGTLPYRRGCHSKLLCQKQHPQKVSLYFSFNLSQSRNAYGIKSLTRHFNLFSRNQREEILSSISMWMMKEHVFNCTYISVVGKSLTEHLKLNKIVDLVLERYVLSFL